MITNINIIKTIFMVPRLAMGHARPTGGLSLQNMDDELLPIEMRLQPLEST